MSKHTPPELKKYNAKDKPCPALYCIGINQNNNKFVKIGMSINLLNRLRNYKTVLTHGFYILALIIFNADEFPLSKDLKATSKTRIKWVLEKEQELHSRLAMYYDSEGDEWTGSKESYRGDSMTEILNVFKQFAEDYAGNVEKAYYKPFRSHIKADKNADGIPIKSIETAKIELEQQEKKVVSKILSRRTSELAKTTKMTLRKPKFTVVYNPEEYEKQMIKALPKDLKDYLIL